VQRTVVVVVFVLSGTAVGALASPWSDRAGALLLARPLQAVRVERPDTWWRVRGYVAMTPPVRPPTSVDRTLRIVVYLKVPDGSTLSARWMGDPKRATLRFPAGTMADRVEYVGSGGIDDTPAPDWRAADVRGTALGEASELFHVYRPTSTDPRADLVGVQWPRGDVLAQDRATEALGALVERGRVLGPQGATERRASASHLRAINGCSGCHVPDRDPREHVSDPGIASRGTDDSGFFQASSVFDDRAPLESYRPRNANQGDRFVRYVCGRSQAPATAQTDGSVSCASGEVPIGILDIRAALREGDAHARSVCASRLYLFERLDGPGQKAMAEPMAVCDEGKDEPP
jgi:hypothetical protein